MTAEWPPSRQWWREPKGKAGASIIAAVNAIQDVTLGLQERFLRSMRAFGGNGYMSTGRFPSGVGGGVGGPLGMGARSGPRDNITYALVSTVLSQLMDDGPYGVSFLTSHGDWEMQRRAEMLEQFSDGIAYQTRLDTDEFPFHLQDSLITGDGFIEHELDENGNIYSERAFPAEFMVDIWDGRDRRPRSLYRVGFIDRDVLAARYPDSKKKIMDARPQMPPGFSAISATQTNVIPFIKAWHLPTFVDYDKNGEVTGTDGRFVLTLSNDLTICDREYCEDEFPITHTRFCLLPTGYHGMGIAEIVQGHQLSLNDANRAEYWAWSQVGIPRVWMQTNTVNKDHLNSSLSGLILEGTVPPQVLNWSATHPDFVKWKADIKAAAAQLVGVSFMAMSGVKPPGLDSGEAQREYKDTLHSRFSLLSQWAQEARVDCARKQIMLARHAYQIDPDWSVRIIGKNFIKRLAAKQVFDNLEDDEFVLKAKPVSQLPKSVPGQIQTATEMVQGQFATPQEARKIITSVPDVGAWADLSNAAYDNAKQVAYSMLHEGKQEVPDLQLGDAATLHQVITAEGIKAKENGAPRAAIERVRTYLVQLKALMAQQAAAAAPPPGTPPVAQGLPPPKTPLLPFKQPG